MNELFDRRVVLSARRIHNDEIFRSWLNGKRFPQFEFSQGSGGSLESDNVM